MPEEPENNEQQPVIPPQPSIGQDFTETNEADNPEMESFVSDPELESATPVVPTAPVDPVVSVEEPAPSPMTGMNIDGIQNGPEPAGPTMAPESLPVQSAPTIETTPPMVVPEVKKSKTTLYLIIAIVVVVLATTAYFAYKFFV